MWNSCTWIFNPFVPHTSLKLDKLWPDCFKLERMPRSTDKCALKRSPKIILMDGCDMSNCLGESQAIPWNHSENDSWKQSENERFSEGWYHQVMVECLIESNVERLFRIWIEVISKWMESRVALWSTYKLRICHTKYLMWMRLRKFGNEYVSGHLPQRKIAFNQLGTKWEQ